MHRPLLLLILLLLAVGCGDDDGGSVLSETTGTVAEPPADIVVETPGETWELPAQVCLRADGDAAFVDAYAERIADNVHTMVAQAISGWPTTTAQPPDQQEIWARNLRGNGILALTLAGLVGKQAALEQAWVDYEQSFADPEQGWGPPQVIALQVDEWKATARTLTRAIADYCAG